MTLNFGAQGLEGRYPGEELTIMKKILEFFRAVITILAQKVHESDEDTATINHLTYRVLDSALELVHQTMIATIEIVLHFLSV